MKVLMTSDSQIVGFLGITGHEPQRLAGLVLEERLLTKNAFSCVHLLSSCNCVCLCTVMMQEVRLISFGQSKEKIQFAKLCLFEAVGCVLVCQS